MRTVLFSSSASYFDLAITHTHLIDICPVCKSSRYLNANMRFLINPACYHRMCSSCVDRIFSHGPANCPIAGCKRTLRKPGFRPQKFEDLTVEREVDIRRRMAAIFNRREEEFENLRDYNDYLQEAEDLTYNSLHGIDEENTTKKIQAYEAAHAEGIKENAALASQETYIRKARQAEEKEFLKLRREAARREQEDERREREEGRRGVIDMLATGQGDATKIARQAERAAAKRTQLKRLQQSAELGLKGAPISIRGLKQRKDEANAPFDPFGNLSFEPVYFQVQDHYAWDYLDPLATDQRIMAGGYDVKEFYGRSLSEAFSGLAVFVEDETQGKDVLPKATSETASIGAADVIRKKPKAKLADDDVFG